MLFHDYLSPVESGSPSSVATTRCAPPGTPLQQMRNFTLKCREHGFRWDLCPFCGPFRAKHKQSTARARMRRIGEADG